jgi:hypothetical protein
VPLIAIVLLLLVAFWLGRELAHARRRQAFLATRDSRGRPMPPPHQRVSDAQLEASARQLGAAVARGDITEDEAADCLVRLGGAALSVERARALIRARR